MSRPLKSHLVGGFERVYETVGKAACGRFISRRRLVPPESVGRWRSLRALGRSCLDCDTHGVETVATMLRAALSEDAPDRR